MQKLYALKKELPQSDTIIRLALNEDPPFLKCAIIIGAAILLCRCLWFCVIQVTYANIIHVCNYPATTRL